MKIRTPLLLLASVMAGAMVPSNASAAVPTTKATQTIPCPAGHEGAARVWVKASNGRLSKLAIDNPCSWYLGFSGGDDEMYVAPGTHFHWNQKRIRMAQKAGLPVIPGGDANFTDYITCSGGYTISLVSRYNDVRFAC